MSSNSPGPGASARPVSCIQDSSSLSLGWIGRILPVRVRRSDVRSRPGRDRLILDPPRLRLHRERRAAPIKDVGVTVLASR